MRVFVFVGILSVLFIHACAPDNSYTLNDKVLAEIPDSIIAFDSMVNIMTDIHLAETWARERSNDSLNQDQRLALYYAQIFHAHNISLQQYNAAYAYYSSEPLLMNVMYQRVTENLNLLESTEASKKNKSSNNE
ncbi:MAG: DUF4296 domain-containing protein [Chitinophagales bacterium]